MNQLFDIPVSYEGKELSLPAEFIVLGYIYQIHVDLNGQEITFEPDEERRFRAVMDPKRLEDGKKIDVGLLKAVADKLETYCKLRSC